MKDVESDASLAAVAPAAAAAAAGVAVSPAPAVWVVQSAIVALVVVSALLGVDLALASVRARI